MAKAPSKETIKRATIADMKAIGTHKPQYNRLIDIYAELVHQYSRLTIEFEESGYQYEVATDQGGAKKSPILASLETLRKDILAYSDRLCLNPKSLETVTIEAGKKSKLADALSRLE
ncbi:P27 family phage terminase small subunit [Cohnella lubricantis]|uniref:P27 family phage terminase small subunit n=1 Tax=Cohnella lubricantis TaxID=2163172 RepID=A0A841T871_9BACL|nr:P27 family phage terminase small subunit [Cohnella lubricantis]MBB6677514.1 P27 family phage terminase small subunit [Cohnella lubricantis]MBP2116600.1 phage terminase small subunit [Cohnella lubricantis]